VGIDNTPPRAYCGSAYAIDEGSSVEVSGALSSDALSGVARYFWTVGSNASPSAGEGQNFTVRAEGHGSYFVNVGLKAIDGAGNSDYANCTLNVSNVAPVVVPSASENATEGEPVSFSAEFTDPGKEFGENYSFEWFFGDGIRGEGKQASHAYSVTAPYNLYNATIFVNDGTAYGNATIQLNVSNAKPFPHDFEYLEIFGQRLVFVWEADHPPGITLFSKVEYFDNFTSQNPPRIWQTACVQYGRPYRCEWNASALAKGGVYPLRLTVSDGIGETTLYGTRNYTKGKTAWSTT
jgi:hypothetical protein